MECMKLLKIIVMFLNLVRGVWKKKNDLKHCKWNFQIDTGFQIRHIPFSFSFRSHLFRASANGFRMQQARNGSL